MQEKRREVRLQGAPAQVSVARGRGCPMPTFGVQRFAQQQRAPSSHTEVCNERHARVFVRREIESF
jgi:hypothetical protein